MFSKIRKKADAHRDRDRHDLDPEYSSCHMKYAM